MRLKENVVMSYAHQKKIDCFTDADESLSADLLIVVSYGNMIPKRMLEYRFGSLNLHPSFLPKYRGSSPIQRAMISGDKKIGVSWMRLVEELDAGPIAFQGSVDVDYKNQKDNYSSVKNKISIVGSNLLVKNWESIFKSELKFKKQIGKATWADRIGKEDRVLDFMKTAESLNNIIKALDPSPGARCRHHDGWVIFKDSSFSNDFELMPGSVDIEGDSLVVGTAKGVLVIGCVIPDGRKPMSGKDFLNSRPNAKFN